MKICGNSHQIIFQNFVNFEQSRIYFYQNDGEDNKYSLQEHLIYVKGNKMEFHTLINIKNSLEIKKEENYI